MPSYINHWNTLTPTQQATARAHGYAVVLAKRVCVVTPYSTEELEEIDAVAKSYALDIGAKGLSAEADAEEEEGLDGVLCGECAGHGDALQAAGLNPKSLRAVATAWWMDRLTIWTTYEDGITLSGSDKGACDFCGCTQ